MRYSFRCLILGMVLLTSGCFYGTYHESVTDTAVGEEHEVNFSTSDTLSLVQNVLRGDGILFELQPDNSLITLWKNAENQPGFFSGLFGVTPRYRYEIRVLPEAADKSKIIANVRTEGIPEDQIDLYKPSRRFDMFHKLDQLATRLPPSPKTPISGGVNYALLPNEDLKGLAKRVTGNAENWHEIAKDNGIASPSDVSAFQTVWVRNELLKSKPKSPAALPKPSHDE